MDACIEFKLNENSYTSRINGLRKFKCIVGLCRSASLIPNELNNVYR